MDDHDADMKEAQDNDKKASILFPNCKGGFLTWERHIRGEACHGGSTAHRAVPDSAGAIHDAADEKDQNDLARLVKVNTPKTKWHWFNGIPVDDDKIGTNMFPKIRRMCRAGGQHTKMVARRELFSTPQHKSETTVEFYERLKTAAGVINQIMADSHDICEGSYATLVRSNNSESSTKYITNRMQTISYGSGRTQLPPALTRS